MCNIICTFYKNWRRQCRTLWSFFWMCWYHENMLIWGETLLLQFSIWTECVYMRERRIQRPATLKHFSDFHIDSILEVSRDRRFFLATFPQTLIANPEKIIRNRGDCWLLPTARPERTPNIEPVCISALQSVLPMWLENLMLDRLIF